jgi:hypothetical protein
MSFPRRTTTGKESRHETYRRAAEAAMTPDTVDLLTKFGLPTAALILVLWSGAKGYWVFGPVHREIVQRLNVDIANLRNEVRELRTQ